MFNNLLRTYLLEIIFNAQKLAPVSSFVKTNNTTEVIACSFIRLLESQFPLESPRIVFLASVESSFLTGTEQIIDGGMSIQ